MPSETIPVIFLTYPAITNTIFLPSVRPCQKNPGQTLYQNQFPNIFGKKLHQIFHHVRTELLPSSLFWHILGIPQHYYASNLISRWLSTVTRVFMPNLHHAPRAPVTIPASSMWPTGPFVPCLKHNTKQWNMWNVVLPARNRKFERNR